MEIYLGAGSGTNLENDLCILWHLCLIMFFLVILNGPDSLLVLVIKHLHFFVGKLGISYPIIMHIYEIMYASSLYIDVIRNS